MHVNNETITIIIYNYSRIVPKYVFCLLYHVLINNEAQFEDIHQYLKYTTIIVRKDFQ